MSPPEDLGWRQGRKVGRTIYLDGRLIGLVDTPELAKAICAEMNAYVSGQEPLIHQMLEALEGLVGAIDPANIMHGTAQDELESKLYGAIAEARRVLALAKAVMR